MTQEDLKDILSYDSITGVFRRKLPTQRIAIGEVVGGLNNGYLIISINGENYKAHRLAWLYVYGEMPKQLDHINGDKIDNRILNLRDVEHSENMKNRKKPITNTSGTIGVYWDKKNCRWYAMIMVDGKNKFLGRFTDYSEAVNARKNAEVLYGFHKNHGS